MGEKYHIQREKDDKIKNKTDKWTYWCEFMSILKIVRMQTNELLH